MPAGFVYSFTCPQCGVEFQERRDKPYKRLRTKKLCSDCKNNKKPKTKVKVIGGLTGDEKCLSCRFYTNVNGWWGRCSKGYSADEDVALNNDSGYVYMIDLCDEYCEGNK